MTKNLFEKDLTKLKPKLIIKNKEAFESTGLNMAMRIWDISPTVSKKRIVNKLNKILEADEALNGILLYSYISHSRLELLCFISTQKIETTPLYFYSYYSRLLTEISFSNKLFRCQNFEMANKIAKKEMYNLVVRL